jgi:hypothetical protein
MQKTYEGSQMSKANKAIVATGQEATQKVVATRIPKSLGISENGIETTNDLGKFMSALISDIMTSRVSPQMANAAVNAGGRMLKAYEMQFKYGQAANEAANTKQLRLVS